MGVKRELTNWAAYRRQGGTGGGFIGLWRREGGRERRTRGRRRWGEEGAQSWCRRAGAAGGGGGAAWGRSGRGWGPSGRRARGTGRTGLGYGLTLPTHHKLPGRRLWSWRGWQAASLLWVVLFCIPPEQNPIFIDGIINTNTFEHIIFCIQNTNTKWIFPS